MGFLQSKKILIIGMISERSIAYDIAKAYYEQSAELAFTYVVDKLEKCVRKMAAELDSELVLRCDVAGDNGIDQVFVDLGKHQDGLDDLVHSIDFAPKEALSGDFPDSISHETFNATHEISVYSPPALAKTAHPMMQSCSAAIAALDYLGAVRAIPNYNIMGMARTSLEASIRFIATCLDKEGTRCDGISTGPIKTLAASGIVNLNKLLGHATSHNPPGHNMATEEIGNTAVFFLSGLASGITGEVTYIDGGCSINTLNGREN